MTRPTGIDASAPPSGEGCLECDETGGWWFHLRRCAQCGHIGCCDSSPAQHAREHAGATGHFVIRSFEPGESWFWDFAAEAPVEGPDLPPPRHRPAGRPAPGPRGRVPADWQRHLH